MRDAFDQIMNQKEEQMVQKARKIGDGDGSGERNSGKDVS